jgi:hypothetical protein
VMEREAIESRASLWKGRMERSMASRKALDLILEITSEGMVDVDIVLVKMEKARQRM